MISQHLVSALLFLSLLNWVLVTGNGQRKLGDRCESSNDCGSQLICHRWYCEVAEPVDGERCSVANQCREGNACKHGICWKLARIPCRVDRDCPPSLYCTRDYCLSQRSSSSSQRYCTGNRRPYYSRGEPLECDSRAHRNQCPRNYFCDPKTEYCCEDDDDSRERYGSTEDLELGERCSESRRYNPCRTRNADCINGKCRCISGYAEENNRCVRKASRRRKVLGKECSSISDCETPYSDCVGRVCTCRPGYAADGENCTPRVYNCPSFTPLTVNGKLTECEITFSRNGSPTDNCPKGSFCVSYGSPSVTDRRLRDTTAEGFCCPKIASVCPVGLPTYVADQDCARNCPRDTHFCHKSGERIWGEVCCEKPCMDGEILERGKCIPEYKSVPGECDDSREKVRGRCQLESAKSVTPCKAGMLFANGKCVEPQCSRGKPLFTADFNFVLCTDSCTKLGTFCEKSYGICCSV
uniref:G_PROTEIN_RECEP_F2_3 domain-containing protein n=1 Tax=Trichuris muris TaxID=70415 RepID=A0A5S6Q8G3_TRIMR